MELFIRVLAYEVLLNVVRRIVLMRHHAKLDVLPVEDVVLALVDGLQLAQNMLVVHQAIHVVVGLNSFVDYVSKPPSWIVILGRQGVALNQLNGFLAKLPLALEALLKVFL